MDSYKISEYMREDACILTMSLVLLIHSNGLYLLKKKIENCTNQMIYLRDIIFMNRMLSKSDQLEPNGIIPDQNKMK